MVVKEIPFSELSGWNFDQTTSNLAHETGRFFSIEGLDVQVKTNVDFNWQQPIIHQPEIGILGFLTCVDNGVRKFLVQAKMEPGNVHQIQISPTVQATYSNYSGVHRGKIPPYLEYFQDSKNHAVICDRLQSEQGARFYKKRNRNMIVEINYEPHLLDDFYWLSYCELKKLFAIDNLINMDARSVLSNFYEHHAESSLTGIEPSNCSLPDFRQLLKASLSPKSRSQHTAVEVLSIIDGIVSRWNLSATLMPLRDVSNWEITDKCIKCTRHLARFILCTCIKSVA